MGLNLSADCVLGEGGRLGGRLGGREVTVAAESMRGRNLKSLNHCAIISTPLSLREK
jgi:hypothetical protein